MNQPPLSPEDKARLLAAARSAVGRAYAPYSGLKVGAAVLTPSGDIYAGANVENASYGLTICAERAAVCAAMATAGPTLRLTALAVVSDRPGPLAPCGACRQVLHEFGPQALVIFQGEEGMVEMPLSELLPTGFRLP
jgi:cytidine deaminase